MLLSPPDSYNALAKNNKLPSLHMQKKANFFKVLYMIILSLRTVFTMPHVIFDSEEANITSFYTLEIAKNALC